MDGRAYGHVITQISRMGRLPQFLGYGFTLARSASAHASSSDRNFKNLDKPNKLASVNQNVLLIKGLSISVQYL